MIVEWVKAVSLVLIAACMICERLRLLDGFVGKADVVPGLPVRSRHRPAETRMERAENWIEMKKQEAGKR